jgi:hypothetical protein
VVLREPNGDLGTRVKPELAEDIRNVSARGAAGNTERFADLTIAQAGRDQAGDLALTAGQRPWIASRSRTELAEHT